VAPDLQAVTFKLREGVQWHQDYGEFTAQNLIASYEAMVSEHSITTYKEEYWSRVMAPANAAGNFEALGDHEITFKYSSPQLDSDLFVSRIVDFTILSKAHTDKEGMVEGPRNNPVGTGPYRLQEHKLGEAYVFERVP
jgi:peptide/nickel transport system substrate-binding protein